MVIPHTEKVNVSYRMYFELMVNGLILCEVYISATAALYLEWRGLFGPFRYYVNTNYSVYCLNY